MTRILIETLAAALGSVAFSLLFGAPEKYYPECGLTGAVLITTVGWIIAQSMPHECARLFTSDQTLISISERAITLTMITFPLVGAQMASTGFFQSIGKAKISMLLSLSRQLLFFLPALLVLPNFYQTDGVWLAQPISDVISFVVATWLLRLCRTATRAARRAAAAPISGLLSPSVLISILPYSWRRCGGTIRSCL